MEELRKDYKDQMKKWREEKKELREDMKKMKRRVEGMEKTIVEGRKERGGGKLSGREIERRVEDIKRR